MNNNLGKLIKEQRTKKNLSLRGLAKQIDIGRMTLSRIEKGTRYILLSDIIKIAQVLELDFKEILESYGD